MATHRSQPIEGTVSPKHQITIPAAVRDALGVHPGDKLEFAVKGEVLELRVKRRKPSEIIGALLHGRDISRLRAETKDDATAAVRAARWDDA